MSFHRLFLALIGFALALAPLGVPSMATTPPGHHGDMVNRGHCDQQSQPDQHHKAADKSCCVAMCIAMVIPSGTADLPIYHPARQRLASDLDRHGFLGEIATPPPRAA